eukprot:TRINITY_DN13757_c0_g1_i4.p1 TRINITY_DN13757_c0_g1~~TRINITY_DN13757_c0_g1_i4.p1  ORF type:complete len:102 (+),score=40.44 TRINITY_DN13757_c0_g1_i4:18-323(+)
MIQHISILFITYLSSLWYHTIFFFFFQAEDGIRDAQESRGLGDVYKRQVSTQSTGGGSPQVVTAPYTHVTFCLLYTSDAADEEDSVDLGGRRIIKKKKKKQ